ncbi:MAG TPA: hypothetical protein VJG13_00285, partial [Thermoanaerobaculia bacterium]|nr:hypothetical protein [Thermoanaerobaculia bacterium]
MRLPVSLLLALVAFVRPLAGLQPPEEVAPPPAAEEEAPAETPPEVGSAPLIPELNVYLPEGELDIRLNRLVKKVFAEGQVKYNFVDGDIAAFLR